MHVDCLGYSSAKENEIYLHNVAEGRELCLGFLELFLLLFVFGELESFLGDGDERFAVELAQLLDAVLVDGLAHVEHFETALRHALNKRRVLDDFDGLTGDEVDVLLVGFILAQIDKNERSPIETFYTDVILL